MAKRKASPHMTQEIVMQRSRRTGRYLTGHGRPVRKKKG